MPPKPSKILIACFDNLGDLIFTTGAYQNLRTEFPQCEVGIWCKEYTKHAAVLFPGPAKVFASDPFWDRAPGRRRGSIWKFLKAMYAIRKHRFDCAILTSKHWRGAVALWLLGIPVRIGYQNSKSRFFLNVMRKFRGAPAVLEHSQLTKALGCRTESSTYKLSSPSSNICHLHAEETIVLHPFAGSATRCWPLLNWLELADHIRENLRMQVRWVGSKKELARVTQLLRDDHSHEICDIHPEELSLILDDAAYFIGHDSGPLHLASALGKRVLGLYLPGEVDRTYPQGSQASAVIHKHNPDDLDLNEVVANLHSLLKTHMTKNLRMSGT